MRTVLRLLTIGLAFLASLLFVLATPALAADGSSTNLSETASWGLIAGVLLPLLTSVVQQPKWTNRTRVFVGWGLALVAGVLTCLANGTLDNFDTSPETVLGTIALVMVASQATYAGWKKSGVAPAIENATSKTPPAAPDLSGERGYADRE